MSQLWDPIFGASAVAEATSDRAWLRALTQAEAALARAAFSVGLLDAATARAIEAACAEVAKSDPAELGRLAAADGNPVIPLVRELRTLVAADAGASAASAVHLGATSQDVMDTASMLVARGALDAILPCLDSAGRACATLAEAHRDTMMTGRTLLQQAEPTTFGAVAAGWGQGVDRADASLRAARAGLAVQLGGAAGTLAALHPHGPAVRAAFAAELGLSDPGMVWHSERSRIAELAATLGVACGVLAKIATDVVLLAQNEIGELHEQVGGGSSSMPHKQNAVAAITARAAAAQAPGLVATLLAAMPSELQRGAGPWHAEWQPLNALLNATGGAAARVAESLSGVRVDADGMARNLEQLAQVDARHRPGADAGHAGDMVDDYLRGRSL